MPWTVYTNKLDNLEERDTFLETPNLPTLNHEETHNSKQTVSYEDIDSLIRKLPTKKSMGPHGFTGEFCQTFEVELMPILLKLFQRIEEEATLPQLFHEASIALIPTPEKHTIKKENYRPKSLVNTDVKIFYKPKWTEFTNILKRSYTVIKWNLFQRLKDGSRSTINVTIPY